jgi:single-stranded-DNA-specific exonuclease
MAADDRMEVFVQKKWDVATPVPPSYLDRFPALSPLLLQVLYNRGVDEPESFLSGAWSLTDPFTMADMPRAVDILTRATKNKVPIAVYGDFDTDGVTATALLVQTLTELGADVRPYIPNRVEEGYGLNLDALRKLYRDGVRLVVTVDCGIRSLTEIDQARRGIEFIVTDHHSIGSRLPPASAVLNPKREDCRYPYKELAGVGVALKLAQALLYEAGASRLPADVAERSLLDLVALGTVSDVAPLLGENRALVKRGLEVLNEPQREGVRALIRVAGAGPGKISAATIGFGLGPRLNASGRLGDSWLSYNLLVTHDVQEARRLAAKLDEQNRLRQELTMKAYQRAEQIALAHADEPLLFAAADDFASGIVGLVAGRLTEAYYRPSVVVETGDTVCKGSCRSIKEFHITRALDECSDLLLRHGGHAAAAGFTVAREHLDTLARRLSDIARRELDGKDLAPTLAIDADVPLADMNWAIAEWLRKLEPCGERNPIPLFLSRRVPVVSRKAVGNEGVHLKLALGTGSEEREAIAFRMGERLSRLGDQVDVVYALDVNKWNGDARLQLNVQDIRTSAG